jgi:hypothetical protein
MSPVIDLVSCVSSLLINAGAGASVQLHSPSGCCGQRLVVATSEGRPTRDLALDLFLKKSFIDVVKIAPLLIGKARKRPHRAPEWANSLRSALFETGQFAGPELQGFLC